MNWQNLLFVISALSKEKLRICAQILILAMTEDFLNCSHHLTDYYFAQDFGLGGCLLCLLSLSLYRIGCSSMIQKFNQAI